LPRAAEGLFLIGAHLPLFRPNPRKLLRNFLELAGLANGRCSLEFIMVKTVALVLAATIATSGCATRRENAALTGGAIGAGGGALLGAAAGFNPLVGAAVGGGAGATVGALTH
jgi:hypothetical protein